MPEVEHIVNNIFSVNKDTFTSYALQVFKYQYANNEIYRQWVNHLRVDVSAVLSIEQIPFLPISFFKTHKVVSVDFTPEVTFESSGTTGQQNSKHFVKDASLYIKSFTEGFNMFYGNIEDYCILGLLPSYLERTGSSLVMMVDDLVKKSKHPQSNFYLYDFEGLATVLKELEAAGQRTILIGVTFALLDFAQQHPLQLNNTIVMETGGMKGRKKEMIRPEVHEYLKQQLGITSVHSEYGMTELLSQAYSKGEGKFESVPWMQVLLRDDEDPLDVYKYGKGLINVIDLANIHSCSFIATDDAGVVHADGSFEVIGRRDNSDIRGCSLMLV